jgi:hypothetical protein
VLAFTVGTWVLSFVAAFQGGIWEEVAGYTPSEMLQSFRRGLVRLDLVLAALVLIAAALVLAAVWMRLGMPMQRKVAESALVLGVAAALAGAASLARPSWDVSENERNSFAALDAAILSRITAPLRIEAHLAPEDPRRFDLEKQTLSKLRRTMPNVTVAYVAGSVTGLFEQASEHYGEIWYDLGGKRLVGRAATTDGVLDAIYELAGVQPPQEGEAVHRGHPLAAQPTGAMPVFYIAWPLAVLGFGLFLQRRRLS